MTPWQRAKAWHDDHVTDETFEETLGWYLTHGLVYSTPEVFLLARQVYWDAEAEEMHDDREPNAWFVELAASAGHANPVREFMRVASRPQQYALWCRHNQFEIRAYDWRKLARKVGL
jgi:uncharacterized membrane-anchored protein